MAWRVEHLPGIYAAGARLVRSKIALERQRLHGTAAGVERLTTSLINSLANVATASAQSSAQFRLKLIGAQITAQLNKKINQLKEQAQDPAIPLLQQQEAALNHQKQAYDQVLVQFGNNGSTLGDLSIQLSTLANAAAQGDSTTFDQTLGAANTDLGILQIVPALAGFLPDGIASLASNGLGIQSSATYDLSTPAGQARASADVQAAQSLVQQIAGTNTTNQEIGSSISQSLGTQLTAVSDQVSSKQNAILTDDAAQVDKLNQQAKTDFHLIELQFGNIPQTGSIISNAQNANNIAPPPGSVISVLVGNNSGAALPVANLPTLLGNNVSTSA